ncbi:MFS transporter-9 [Coleophoma cylindrospora]|uniref:MFS transporter-9 n=1 Tax=Coleophoma cylindrospora TaxID=1849047 RepID=A0A3D8RLQ3_9HELO|nr:MFS transporter-9 [Coleophoma cylindrospora]
MAPNQETTTIVSTEIIDLQEKTEHDVCDGLPEKIDLTSSSPFPISEEKYADVTLLFLQQHEHNVGPLTPEKEKKLKRKLYCYVVLLAIVIDLILYIDKATLSYSSILGLFEETGIDTTEYNNLNTIFYVGYIVGQWPATYLIQRLPFGKTMATIIFIWAVIIFLHCTATDYGGLIALRFFLGATESVVIPALEITLGMFFTKEEQAYLQPIFFSACMGSPIVAGFIAYGLLHVNSYIKPWKLFMIVTGGLTMPLAIYSWFMYPNNPAEARFLTIEERVHTIQRVHNANRSSIEQKHFKKSQFVETLRDPISWLFALQCFTNQIANNLAYQQNLLYVSLGVSNLGSTLVSAAGGGFSVVCCIIATVLLRWFPGYNAYWAMFWFLPALAGGIGMVALDWESKLSLLACLVLAGSTFGISYIIALGWTTSSASGYTKKLTRNVMFMFGYGIANIISPQIWVDSYAPRYYPAWVAQIVISWVGTPLLLLLIRYLLIQRNKERYLWIAEQEAKGVHSDAYVTKVDSAGQTIQIKTDVTMLDLTDLENRYFIYPL